MEYFKKIKGYENYLISNQGRVFNFKFKKFLKPTKDRGGYLLVNLWKNGIRKLYRIHRLVALAFIPNPENKETVNHIDGVKINNFAINLEWATNKENTQHALNNGLLKPIKGSKNSSSKLTEDQVLEIRRIYSSGEISQRALGEMFDVTQMLISYIVRRKNWNHI